MNWSPFHVVAPDPASYVVSLEPAYNALLSLAALTAPPAGEEVDAWVARAAAGLSPEQRRRNRLIFEGLGEALALGSDYPDFPAYLDALASAAPSDLRDRVLRPLLHAELGSAPEPSQLLSDAPTFVAQAARLARAAALDQALLLEVHQLLNDPPAMQQLVVGHLRELWAGGLKDEWQRLLPDLSSLVTYLRMRPMPEASAADLIRFFIGRELPDSISALLDGVRQVIFVLSPHIRLHAARFGSPTTIWVFVLGRFTELPARQAPIKRGELLRPFSALADDTRLHILELLAQHGELATQALIAELDQSQPNVSRHLKQLTSAGFVTEQRGEAGNKRYRLNPKQINTTFWALKQLISPANRRTIEADMRTAQPLPLRRFLDNAGRLTIWPAKRQDQDMVLSYLASKFTAGREYTEREVNDILNQWHTYKDHATLRRDLYDARLFDRTSDGARYWRVADDRSSSSE